MNHLLQTLLVCTGGLSIAGCANYHLHIPPTSDRTEIVEGDIAHKIFLVGDAGEASKAQYDNLKLMKSQLNDFDGRATVLYLGDNIYPQGLPPQKDTFPRISRRDSDLTRPFAEAALMPQIHALESVNADVQAYFVPGNHDWKKGKVTGLKTIRRQGKFLKELGIKNVQMLPKKGCPGPEEVKIGDDLVLLIVDSQWWLQDWSKETDINKHCEVQSRLDFLAEFDNAVKDNIDKQIIVVMHHPLISSGPHGGYFGTKDHFLPLTQLKDWLVLPVPFLYPILRGTFGNVQDIVHRKYSDLKSGIRAALAQYNKSAIIVSGHEHALEYHKYKGDHYIVSGAGARHPNKIAKTRTMQFGHGATGFMVLDVTQSGAINLAVYEPGHEHGTTPVYTVNLVSGEQTDVAIPKLPDPATIQDSTIALISEDYSKSGLYRLLFGERYRSLYNLPIKVRNINLTTERGGLSPIKKGGGFQTNSLRLADSDGKQFVLRGLNKDATRLLPEIFQSTFAKDILQDQFTASHPYAAFIIPELAQAAGIYYTNPEIVFLPAQEGLGRFNDAFADQMYLYEERPSGDWEGYENFGGSKNLISYGDMVEKTMDKYTNRVDQEFVLRSRLFDMFISDWDRHDDQWRWATLDSPDGKGKMFRPVPRDRDQALSTFDGLIVKLANWYTPTLRKMGEFTNEIKRIKWFNFNARYFDRDFLNGLTREQWIATATELKGLLTDEVIEESLRNWPKEIFEKQGEEIIETLKKRRDNLPDFARRYYEVLSKVVMIRGTNDADYFQITRSEDATRVRVYDSNKEGDKREMYYDRTFSNHETRNIQIYGLDGKDRFVVDGQVSDGIKLQLVGGEGHDIFEESGGISRSRLLAFDTHGKSRQTSDAITYLEVTDDDNTYDRRSFAYDYGLPLLVIGVNPDDGFLLGGGIQLVKHGFKKEPFASRHSLQGSFAFGSGSFSFDYLGEWNEVFGNIGAGINAVYHAPNYVQNFFGLGNDSDELTDDINFYRIHKRTYRVVPFIRFGDETGHTVLLHVGHESNLLERTPERFISDAENGLPDSDFEEQNFGVARFDYQFQIIDNPIATRRGFKFKVTGGIDKKLKNEVTHRYFKTSLATYYQLKYFGKPVIATRVGAEWHGGDLQFYQGAILGASSNFRGMRAQRFVGSKSVYFNTDIRFRLSQFQSYYLPSSFGIVINFDYGRVWLDGEQSDTWHYAYGGGVWFTPFQSLLLSLNYNVSDVDERFNLGMGFFF